jgi:hypothetical protein
MSTTLELLKAVQGSALGLAVRKSNHLVGAGLQILHVVGFVLLLAALVLVSLRLLGLVLKQYAVPQVTREATRLIWVGLGLAVLSGTLMFVGSPVMYFYKWAFELKMLLLVVAVVVQVTLLRRVAANEAPSPALARVSVALSLVFWFGIGLAGRMIGFT